MKVLLLYPEFPDVLEFQIRLEIHPEEGCVAAARPVDRGRDVAEGVGKRLVDVNVRKLGEKDLAWAEGRTIRVANESMVLQ